MRCAACAKCDWRDGRGLAGIGALCEVCYQKRLDKEIELIQQQMRATRVLAWDALIKDTDRLLEQCKKNVTTYAESVLESEKRRNALRCWRKQARALLEETDIEKLKAACLAECKAETI